MKRTVALCLALILVVTALPMAQALAATNQIGIVKGGWLRLRETPSFSAETLASYPTGTQVTILGTSGSWYRVQGPDNMVGYMYGTYLDVKKGSVTPSTPTSGTAGYVTSKNGKDVRLRAEPSQKGEVIGLYSVGTACTILTAGTSWHYIAIGKQKGYMMAEYIAMSSAPAPTPTPVTPVSYSAYVTSANGKGVNLRESASRTSRSLGLFPVGTPLTVLSYGTTWCNVLINNTMGYMMTTYITTKQPAPAPGKTVTGVALSNYTPVVGTVLTATISPANATVSYQWYDDTGRLLSSASSYTVPYDMTGRKIYVKVTGYGQYSGTASSSYTVAVGAKPAGTAVTAVSLSNTSPKVGDTISAAAVPADATVNYAWYRDDMTFVFSGRDYKVPASDEGHKLYCVASGTGNTSGSAASQYTSPVEKAAVEPAYRVTSVTINNLNPKVGDLLTAAMTPAAGTATYAWYRDDSMVVSTNPTYTVQQADVGHQLYVWATGTGNTSGAATSAMTAKVVSNMPVLTGSVALPNGATVGTTLVPTMSLNTAAVTYQWYQNGVLVSTGSTLLLTDSMAGSDIRLVLQAMPESGFTGEIGSNYCLVQRQVNTAPGITEL